MSKFIDCRIDPSSERQYRSAMKKWMKLKGEDIDGAVKNLGQSIGFGLMRKTYPLGNTQNAGVKFMRSIGIQVEKGAARIAAPTVPPAHSRARNNRGRVAGKLQRVKGSPSYDTKGGPEWEAKKKANAGLLKAAWIIAAEKIPGKFGKRRIPSYVKRHVNKASNGTVTISGSGMSKNISLTNALSYSTNKNTMVQAGIREGYKAVLFQIKNMVEGTGRLKGRKDTII